MEHWLSDPRILGMAQAERAYLDTLDLTPRTRYLHPAGMRTRVLVSGGGNPLIALHGGGGFGAVWAPLMAELRHTRWFVPDRPGFGLSPPFDHHSVDLRPFAVSWIEGLMDELELPAADLVANEIGGAWAIWFTLEHPERVRSLTLMGAPVPVLDSVVPWSMRVTGLPAVGARMVRSRESGPAEAAELWRQLGHESSRLTIHLADLVWRANRVPGFERSWLSLLGRLYRLRGPRPGIRVTAWELQQLQVPVQYLWGDADPFGSPKLAQRAAHYTPGAHYHPTGQGNMPWIDEPVRAGQLLSDFLDASAPTVEIRSA
jgi:pimeloyl-ACP methyl ester carboxylesterase